MWYNWNEKKNLEPRKPKWINLDIKIYGHKWYIGNIYLFNYGFALLNIIFLRLWLLKWNIW